MAVTDEENGRGQQRMMSALEWEDGEKDDNRKVLAVHASVRLSVIHRHITARQN